jgi:hypothetical protein
MPHQGWPRAARVASPIPRGIVSRALGVRRPGGEASRAVAVFRARPDPRWLPGLGLQGGGARRQACASKAAASRRTPRIRLVAQRIPRRNLLEFLQPGDAPGNERRHACVSLQRSRSRSFSLSDAAAARRPTPPERTRERTLPDSRTSR